MKLLVRDGSNFMGYPGYDHRQGVKGAKTFFIKKGIKNFFDEKKGAKTRYPVNFDRSQSTVEIQSID